MSEVHDCIGAETGMDCRLGEGRNTFLRRDRRDLAGGSPLQIEQHLILALETGLQADAKPITETLADSVLSKRR